VKGFFIKPRYTIFGKNYSPKIGAINNKGLGRTGYDWAKAVGIAPWLALRPGHRSYQRFPTPPPSPCRLPTLHPF
jgi:hypothetical protein